MDDSLPLDGAFVEGDCPNVGCPNAGCDADVGVPKSPVEEVEVLAAPNTGAELNAVPAEVAGEPKMGAVLLNGPTPAEDELKAGDEKGLLDGTAANRLTPVVLGTEDAGADEVVVLATEPNIFPVANPGVVVEEGVPNSANDVEEEGDPNVPSMTGFVDVAANNPPPDVAAPAGAIESNKALLVLDVVLVAANNPPLDVVTVAGAIEPNNALPVPGVALVAGSNPSLDVVVVAVEGAVADVALVETNSPPVATVERAGRPNSLSTAAAAVEVAVKLLNKLLSAAVEASGTLPVATVPGDTPGPTESLEVGFVEAGKAVTEGIPKKPLLVELLLRRSPSAVDAGADAPAKAG